jgi:hypothetical protein
LQNNSQPNEAKSNLNHMGTDRPAGHFFLLWAMRKTFFLLCYLAVAFAEEDETDGIVPDVIYHISDTKKLEIIYTGAKMEIVLLHLCTILRLYFRLF